MFTVCPESGDESFEDEEDEAVEPHNLDFMDAWRLEKDGDHDRFDEQRFSIAFNVAKEVCIFSSSKVIKAF